MSKRTISKARGKDDSEVSSLASSLSSLDIDDDKSTESNRPSTSSRVATKPRKRDKVEKPPSGQPGPSGGGGHVQEPTQTQTQRIKFLINVPMKVDENQRQEDIFAECQRLLTLLETTGFSGKDKKHLQDVAIVFGLNGKDSEALRVLLKKLVVPKEKTGLKYAKISYTWGPKGDIKYDPRPTGKKGHEKIQFPIPYQDIREHLKDHSETKKLVRDLRGNDECHVYFSFIDSDTEDFNQIYSSYLEVVKMHIKDHSVPPTVMSTGYEFPEGSQVELAGQVDNAARQLIAQLLPLATYYPEPNFCALLQPGKDTLTESFKSKGQGQTMESANLIKHITERFNFSAIFAEGDDKLKVKPIITKVPPRCTPEMSKGQPLATAQSHYKSRVWAASALRFAKVTFNAEEAKKRGDNYKAMGSFMRFFECDADKLQAAFQECEASFTGPDALALLKAARLHRNYRDALDILLNEPESESYIHYPGRKEPTH